MYSYALHHLGHVHNEMVWGTHLDPNGIPESVREKFIERMRNAKAKAAADAAAPFDATPDRGA
jgi:hypothetical protein